MYSLFFLYLSEQIYKIMKIKLLLISFLLAANALGAAAQVSKTYYVSKPGTLISMMTEEEANSVTHLTLSGLGLHTNAQIPPAHIGPGRRAAAGARSCQPLPGICRTSSLPMLSRMW